MVGFSPRAAVVGLVVLAAGCDVDFVSESGRLGFEAPELHRATFEDFVSGDPIAVGSRVCPRFDGYSDDVGYHEISDESDAALRSCFDIGASGPATYDGQCLQIHGPGEIAWSLQPRSSTCIDDVGLPADQVRFEGMALQDLLSEEAAFVERLASSEEWTGSEGTAPPDLVPTPGAPLVIVEGVTVTAHVGLRDPARDLAVAWTDGEIVVTPPSAEVATYDEDEDDRTDDTVLLRLIDGATAEVALHVAGDAAPAFFVESVPADTLGDLQIVAFFSVDGEAQVPAIVRAIARDAEGRLVRGVPVTWSTDGEIESLPLWGDGRDPDYAVVDVGCRADDEPAEAEHGRITATLGETSAVLDVAWIRPLCSEIEDDDGGDDGRPVGEDEEPGRDDPDGVASCACAAESSSPSPLALVLLGGLVAWMRRRQPARV